MERRRNEQSFTDGAPKGDHGWSAEGTMEIHGWSAEGRNEMTAKRLAAGLYEYRGWKIESMKQFDSNCSHWNITAPDAFEAEDAANTLRAAKDLVDYMEGK